MQSVEYLQLQIRLEGNEIIHNRFVRQVELVPGEEVPLMLIARLADQNLIAYYDETISSGLQEELAANLIHTEFPGMEILFGLLRKRSIPFKVGHYKTYVFPIPPANSREVLCLAKHEKNVKDFGFDGFAEKVYAVERAGTLVAACVSTRENTTCGEAWVYTRPEYRNQGLAQKVIAAWAGSLMNEGKIPFYSHSIDNTASAGLARKLGLQPVYEEITITRR